MPAVTGKHTVIKIRHCATDGKIVRVCQTRVMTGYEPALRQTLKVLRNLILLKGTQPTRTNHVLLHPPMALFIARLRCPFVYLHTTVRSATSIHPYAKTG